MEKVKLKTEKTGLFQEIKCTPGKGLSGRFIFPPFTILNTRDALWIRRKKQWVNLGIKSELGRDASNAVGELFKNFNEYDKKLGKSGNRKEFTTSIFDPVLCELMYSWFCPENGQVIDPFTGGSVRGIVASILGLKYWGCDLSEKQIEANKIQGKEITPNIMPDWIVGDSMKTLRNAPEADFVFSCPPYGNLEVYSDLEDDLSTKSYEGFLELYGKIIRKACHKLKENRFACFVVGNFRDKKTGFYYDLVGDTVRLFEACGLHYYNEAVLITAIGSLPVRAGKVFASGRKLGKTHQNVLVFYKGEKPTEIKDIYK
jgi:hypothetical protein